MDQQHQGRAAARPAGRRAVMRLAGGLAGAALIASRATPAGAATDSVKTVRIAFGNGLAYLPFYVGRKTGMFEKSLASAGFPGVKIEWPKISGTAALNDAMLSGSIDFDVAGTPGLLLIWDRTRGRANAIQGCAGVTTMPLTMVTMTDRIKSLADITPTDRIAMPSSVGTEAIMLRMACIKAFGKGQQNRLNGNIVSLPHPDAVTALMNGVVTGYVGSPPYVEFLLAQKNAHAVLHSPDVFGGETTFVLLCTRKGFAEQNPGLTAAMAGAVGEANMFIRQNPAEAAAIYAELMQSKVFTAAFIEKILGDPAMRFTTQPMGIRRIGAFMAEGGSIAKPPRDWQEVFVAGAPGMLPKTPSY
jgi:NitT/TauT family transport system substrate-binding protein